MAPGSEVRIRIPELHRLPTALIRILAADGIGGAKMDQVLSSEIHVECVGCGIRVSIAELMALRSSPPDDSNPKINRLRLGYCARNSCLSQFYGISVGRDVGLDPELMRERLAAEIASSKPEPEELTDDESPGKSPSSDLIKRGALRIGGAALLVVVFFWWRAGAYIPGISKKPQVFMPVEDVPAHSPAEPHSTVPVLPPPAPPGGNLNAPGRSN